MKTALRILLSLAALIVLVIGIAYADGASFPLDHTASVSGVVAAPPDQVFTRITDIANGPRWRPEVKAVTVLPADNGRDHWTEALAHNQSMSFLALSTEPPTPAGTARRVVQLDAPDPSYGGVWTYELSPGPTASTTTLKITETGFIKPPIYRFMMHHVLGMTYNLDIYLKNVRASFKS